MYEKLVFASVSCLTGESRDEEAAIARHFEVSFLSDNFEIYITFNPKHR